MSEEWLAERRRVLVGIAGLMFVCALVIGLWARHVDALPGERLVMDLIFRTSAEHQLISETTGFFIGTGAPPIVVLVAVALASVVWRYQRSWTWVVPATLAAPAVALLLKRLGGETIPSSEVSGVPVGQAAASLPSAHCAHAAALFGLMVVLALMNGRRDLALFAAIVAAGVGPAMIVNGAHVPSDVLSGYALGVGWLSMLVAIAPRGSPNRRRAISS